MILALTLYSYILAGCDRWQAGQEADWFADVVAMGSRDWGVPLAVIHPHSQEVSLTVTSILVTCLILKEHSVERVYVSACRKKGCYGPPFGKRCLVFVDDLNMPAKATWKSLT